MKVPLVVHLGAASQLAPLAAAGVVRRSVRGPRAWVLLWCAVLASGDGLSLLLGSRHETNLIIYNLVVPIGGAVMLWGLSLWQAEEVPRLAFRMAIGPFVVAWLILTLALSDAWRFSSVADPMAKLVCLGAAAFTLIARSRRTDGALQRHDWFWVSGGMALYFGTGAALSPLSALLVREAPDVVRRAYELKSALDVVAFLAIARGVTCPSAT